MTPMAGAGREFLIHILYTDDDRVEGDVTCDGGRDAVPFSGWLDLLGVLESQLGCRRLRRGAEPPRGSNGD